MGLGDVKLLAMIAAFLGFGQSLLALFLGVLAAALYGLILLARRRATRTPASPSAAFSPPAASSPPSSAPPSYQSEPRVSAKACVPRI